MIARITDQFHLLQKAIIDASSIEIIFINNEFLLDFIIKLCKIKKIWLN